MPRNIVPQASLAASYVKRQTVPGSAEQQPNRPNVDAVATVSHRDLNRIVNQCVTADLSRAGRMGRRRLGSVEPCTIRLMHCQPSIVVSCVYTQIALHDPRIDYPEK